MMTSSRERFLQIANFERVNDPCMWGIAAWDETYRRWAREGMPVNVDMKEIKEFFLGQQDQKEAIIPNAATVGLRENGNPLWVPPLEPFFESRILKEEGKYVIKAHYDGSIIRVKKDDPQSSMPQWLEYPVKDRKSWEEYKKRLDPFSPERFPKGWDIMTEDTLGWPIRKELKGKRFTERDFPLGMICLTLYGGPRYYMGLENLSIAIYEDIKLVEDMIEWQTYFSYEMLKKVFDAGITLDYAWIFEDMAYNHSSLVSPDFVKKYMVPRYKKIVDFLRNNGVDIIILDSDGNINELIPIWLDCGINGFYPLEVAGNMNGIELRKKYGRNIILVGNVDKRMLSKGKKEIDGELEKVRILLKDSGYFPSCDHHIPPDVPYENIVYFLNELRKMSDFDETQRTIEI